jgi:putative NADH-flavin reductase
MNITIFGATGGTGRHVVSQALEVGHAVTAFTRSPEKIDHASDRLKIVTGDIRDTEKVAEAVRGTQAVISTLAPSSNKETLVVSQGTSNIIAAMQQHGIRRLLITAGAGIGDPNDAPDLISKLMNLLLKALSRNVYEDMVETVRLVRTSGLDWTIVRAPMLTDDPMTGKVEPAWVGKGLGMRLTRGDLAAFLMAQLEDDTYLRQAPALSNTP